MLQLARMPRLKSIQLFDMTYSESTGEYTRSQTINPVKTDRALVEVQSSVCGYNNGGGMIWSYVAGVEIQNATTLLATLSVYSSGTTAGVNLRVRVCELWERPRSLQRLAGNGTTSQTIGAVDPARALLVGAYQNAQLSGQTYVPSLGATAVTWNVAVPAALRYQVVQFD